MNLFKKLTKEENTPDLCVYVIYDSKTKSYGQQPGYSVNNETAVRDFMNIISEDPKQMLFTNAEDYSLFKIGGYTRKTGIIETHTPEHVINFHEIRDLVKAKWQQEFEAMQKQQALKAAKQDASLEITQ